MSDRITQKDFKEKFGGDLGRLQSKLALQSPVRTDIGETEEIKRKKYVFLEYELQKQVVQYLEYQFPNVLFESSP
ncbi:hypothetical protein, partial [Bacillus halotolerans]|uniref:hypothetical protein n=1 Tax=Bacillus halotolerans TaxID=260554 RepID=UPI000D42EDFF